MATRIGVAGGDVLALDVLERSPGRVNDEFLIALQNPLDVEVLRREVSSVGGLEIEEIRDAGGESGGLGLSALEHVVALLCTPEAGDFVGSVLSDLVRRTHSNGGAVFAGDGSMIANVGDAPTGAGDLDGTVFGGPIGSGDMAVALRRPTPYRDLERRRIELVLALVNADQSGDPRTSEVGPRLAANT